MNVIVKTNTGMVINPSFEPARGRLEDLMKFYAESYHTYQIDAYRIENQWGVVVAEEGQL